MKKIISSFRYSPFIKIYGLTERFERVDDIDDRREQCS
jgi:hypothetical protein